MSENPRSDEPDSGQATSLNGCGGYESMKRRDGADRDAALARVIETEKAGWRYRARPADAVVYARWRDLCWPLRLASASASIATDRGLTLDLAAVAPRSVNELGHPGRIQSRGP